MESTLYGRLLAQALPRCTGREVSLWPCETINSRHWATIAAEGRYRVCVRTEPDTDCSADYETAPPAGTEWVGVVVQLQDSYGKSLQTQSCWGVETPGFRNVPATDWQETENHIADIAADCLRELLADPRPLISNLYGEICEREQMIAELKETKPATVEG